MITANQAKKISGEIREEKLEKIRAKAMNWLENDADAEIKRCAAMGYKSATVSMSGLYEAEARIVIGKVLQKNGFTFHKTRANFLVINWE